MGFSNSFNSRKNTLELRLLVGMAADWYCLKIKDIELLEHSANTFVIFLFTSEEMPGEAVTQKKIMRLQIWETRLEPSVTLWTTSCEREVVVCYIRESESPGSYQEIGGMEMNVSSLEITFCWDLIKIEVISCSLQGLIEAPSIAMSLAVHELRKRKDKMSTAIREWYTYP